MDYCFCENLSSRQVISDDFFAERFCMKNGKIELERRKEMSKFSVKKPYTVFVAVVICLILGVVSFTRMSTDLLPEFSLPYVVVVTTYPGASPDKVESLSLIHIYNQNSLLTRDFCSTFATEIGIFSRKNDKKIKR